MQKSLQLQEETPSQPDPLVEWLGECELCVDNSPVYQFDRLCCRVRYILGIPLREVRQAWLDRWRQREPEVAAKVEALVLERWESRK